MPEFAGKPAGISKSRDSPLPDGLERTRILKALNDAKGQIGGPDGQPHGSA